MIPSMVAVEKALTVNETLNEDELPKRNGSLKTRSGVVKWENLGHKSRLDPLNQESAEENSSTRRTNVIMQRCYDSIQELQRRMIEVIGPSILPKQPGNLQQQWVTVHSREWCVCC